MEFLRLDAHISCPGGQLTMRRVGAGTYPTPRRTKPMKRLFISCVIAFPLLALVAAPAWAEVKTREKTHITLGGMMGKVFNLFGGKAAKEGVVGTTAVKGNRKATMNESNGQIVDLTEEKSVRPRHEEEDLRGDDIRRAAAPDAGSARKSPEGGRARAGQRGQSRKALSRKRNTRSTSTSRRRGRRNSWPATTRAR